MNLRRILSSVVSTSIILPMMFVLVLSACADDQHTVSESGLDGGLTAEQSDAIADAETPPLKPLSEIYFPDGTSLQDVKDRYCLPSIDSSSATSSNAINSDCPPSTDIKKE